MIPRRDPSPELLERMGLREAPGKPARTTAGSWVTDLASLGKSILLCDFCSSKFNARKYGYVRRQAVAGFNYVIGDCDGCKRYPVQCGLFQKEDGKCVW